MTVLVPNAERGRAAALPGGGARVALSWEPEHMHLVRESAAASPSGEEREARRRRSSKRDERMKRWPARDLE